MRAADHNKVLAMVRRKRPRLVRLQNPGDIHPWSTIAMWATDLKKWVAYVRPGLVNGLDPALPGVLVRNEKFDPLTDTLDKQDRTAVLCDGVGVPLHAFRDGFSGMSKAAALYFAARGAVPKKSNLSGGVNEGGGITVNQTGIEEEPTAWRAVRAVDLYLAVARPSLRGTVDVVDATGLTGQIAQYGATYETSALDRYGSRARLQQAPVFPAKLSPPTAMDILNGVPGDDGEDRQPVCTIFLLSPEQKPDAESAGEPDGSWTAHVQHHLFWNLLYASRYEPPKVAPAPIRLTTGLALADTLGNQILAPLNDLAGKVIAAMQSRNPEGQFYTV